MRSRYIYITDFPIISLSPTGVIREREGCGDVLVDTEKNASPLFFRLVNDFYGNLPIPAPGHSFYRGYFIQSLEPGQLIEKIEKQIASGKCSGQDEQKLKELAATLTENDNNVLFIGKVKK